MDASYLAKLAGESTSELAKLWKTIGVPTSDQQLMFEKLSDDVRAVYNNHLELEMSNKENLNIQVNQLQAKIREDRKWLHHDVGKVIHSKGSLLKRKSVLDKIAEALQQLKDKRQKTKSDILQQLHDIWKSLDITITEGFEEVGSDLSQRELDRWTNVLRNEQQHKAGREEKLALLSQELSNLLVELCLDDEEATPLDRSVANHQPIGLSEKVLHSVQHRIKQLLELKSIREERVKHCAVRITTLWKRLGIGVQEKQQFLGQHAGLGRDTVTACEAELLRLEALKKDKLQEVGTRCREHIRELWDASFVSEDQRAKFLPDIEEEKITEKCLQVHEDYITELEARYKETKPLIELITQREQMKIEIEEFERSCQDPGRFKIPGRLLQEEKFRNTVLKAWPKINAKLAKALPAWEEVYGPLVIDGQRQLDVLLPAIQAVIPRKTLAVSAAAHRTPKKTRSQTLKSTPSSKIKSSAKTKKYARTMPVQLDNKTPGKKLKQYH